MSRPTRAAMEKTAALAGVALEEWMQDWPIEVADPERLAEFVALLQAHAADAEVATLLVDLVLESANDDIDFAAWTPRLVVALEQAYRATSSPAVLERLQYWACPKAVGPEEMFPVTPIVRAVLDRIAARRA